MEDCLRDRPQPSRLVMIHPLLSAFSFASLILDQSRALLGLLTEPVTDFGTGKCVARRPRQPVNRTSESTPSVHLTRSLKPSHSFVGTYHRSGVKVAGEFNNDIVGGSERNGHSRYLHCRRKIQRSQLTSVFSSRDCLLCSAII